MYVTMANEAYALDAASGRQIWHYSRPLTKGVIGDAGTAINRGVAVLGDRVFMVTDHAHMIALNRFTGQLLWDSEMADFRKHYGATSAPLVVKDLVISGHIGRGRRSPRLHRCVQGVNRRARLAFLDHAGAGRTVVGDLGRDERSNTGAWIRG